MNKFYISTIDANAHILAKENGFGLEIAEFCTPWYLDKEFDKIDSVIRGKMKYADRFVLHAPFSELFPCAIDPLIRDVATQRYCQTVKIAAEYGISKIVVHGGYNPKLYFPEWYIQESASFWKEFVNELPENMVFCLENVLEDDPSMLTEILDKVADPRIQMCLDVGHANAYSPIDVTVWLDRCKDYIRHFHIHNNFGKADTHGQLFDGTIPMGAFLSEIDRRCSEATLTLELMDAEPSILWLLEE